VPRLTGLDAMRGIAALMVFAHHAQVPGNASALFGLDSGVLVFFALSGYLLYQPFVAARASGESIDLWVYAIRRAARLLPAFYVASVLIAAIWYPFLLADPVGLLLGIRTPIVVVWTLQLEVGFYVLLPFLAWALAKVPEPHRVCALLGLAATSIGFTVAIMLSGTLWKGVVPSTDLLNIGSLLWAFVPGMIVAELQQRGSLERPIARAVPLAGLVLIGLSVIVDLPPYLDLAAAAGAGLLVASVVSRRHQAPRLARPAVALGAISYSVYLWHTAIIDAVDRPVPSWGGALLSLVITVAIATAVYLMGERPAIRVGHRLVLARRKAQRQALAAASSPARPAVELAPAAQERNHRRQGQRQVEQ
jgi:peptidoglycan/LPS O-acetylase OafA/YrhL